MERVCLRVGGGLVAQFPAPLEAPLRGAQGIAAERHLRGAGNCASNHIQPADDPRAPPYSFTPNNGTNGSGSKSLHDREPVFVRASSTHV
ncbi:hypothetical protein GCM10010278_58210 [Streptomyces melanogenes]|nr:hypothetical protein GCM10010278_58210 [Streptomyces melanogenes]